MSHDENLRQPQKIEMYERMAHDLNNLLSAIIGFCYLLKKQTSQNVAAQDTLEELLKAATKAVEVAQGCMTFARDRSQMVCP